MEFEWDENKNLANKAKHGIRFETAVRAFWDKDVLLEQDRHVDGEERWQLIGLVDAFHLIVVAHTYRDEENGLEKIRIISARPAERHEAKRYDRAKMGYL